MFAQANSEHCRHKIFNADWIVDGVPQDKSLFAMIRDTHRAHPQGTVVAYSDNCGGDGGRDGRALLSARRTASTARRERAHAHR